MLIEFDQWLRKNKLSRYAFARLYKISQPFVSQLINEKRRAAPEMVDYLVRITKLKKAHFRPDLYSEPPLPYKIDDQPFRKDRECP